MNNQESNLARYELNDGTSIPRYQLINKIKELFESKPDWKLLELSKVIGLNKTSLKTILRHLVFKNYLYVTFEKRFNVFRLKNDECLLHSYFMPNYKTFLEQSKKHKGKITRIEDGKNISYPRSIYYNGMSKGESTVYESYE